MLLELSNIAEEHKQLYQVGRLRVEKTVQKEKAQTCKKLMYATAPFSPLQWMMEHAYHFIKGQ